jgi:hypothetical protein
MTREQFEREKNYRAAISPANAMLKNGLISVLEYRKINSVFIKKYRPVFGCLLDNTVAMQGF